LVEAGADDSAALDVLGEAPFCDDDEDPQAASSVTKSVTRVSNDNVRLGIGLLLVCAMHTF
jgi:hypothetical protein